MKALRRGILILCLLCIILGGGILVYNHRLTVPPSESPETASEAANDSETGVYVSPGLVPADEVQPERSFGTQRAQPEAE